MGVVQGSLARTAPETIEYLATLGLAELVTQVHRVDRDRHALCMSDGLAIALLKSRGFDVEAEEDP